MCRDDGVRIDVVCMEETVDDGCLAMRQAI